MKKQRFCSASPHRPFSIPSMHTKIGNIKTISENGELMASYEYDELNQLIREDNKYLETIAYTYSNGTMIQRTEYSYSPGIPLSTLCGWK